jgi:ABC-type amino acid transport substrate-binding protein
VFEPEGIELVIQSVPYTRSIGLVQRGEADAWVGSYRNEVDEGVFYPRWHYDVDQISALGLIELPAPSLATLGEFRLVWMRGYEYQRYLPNLTRYREVQRQSDILNMLNLGRTDFYIDARTEVDEALEAASDPARYRITDLTRLPLYLGFADNPRGRALAQLYDRRMAQLVEQGSLRPLFERWQQPYPFD